MRSMTIKPLRTRLFREGDDLVPFILASLRTKLKGPSIVVVTSKIVALSERRTAPASNLRERARLIRSESELAIPTRYTWLTMKDGSLVASAGIDESNAGGKLVLLPRDSFASAVRIRRELQKQFKVRHLGVLITDSRITPLRAGSTGMAVGYAGFRGLKDYRGQKDLFGRRLKISRLNVADALASAAVVTMGEGRERCPLALIEHAPVTFTSLVRRGELRISPQDDMYAPLMKGLRTRVKRR